MGADLNYFCVAVLCGVLAACSSKQPSLALEYSNNAAKIGLTPIYPPREEFQVGDVFLVAPSKNSDMGDTASIWVGEVPQIAALAEQFMDTRIVFASTAGSDTGTAAVRADADLIEGRLARRGEFRIESLPVSAFPEFTADAGATAGLGIVNLLSSIGLVRSNRLKVTLNFNDVRSYWVEPAYLTRNLPRAPGQPVDDVLNDLVTTQLLGFSTLVAKQELCQEFLRLGRLGVNVVEPGRRLRTQASVITRVYLTRQITYTYFNAQIVAAGIRQGQAGSPLPAQVVQPITLQVNTATGELDEGKLADDVRAISQGISGLAANGARGTSLDFLSWNALGLSFVQTFEKPVTIGYEAVNFGPGLLPADLRKRVDFSEEGTAKCQPG